LSRILHLVFDVEADGPCPGTDAYSMLSIGFASVHTTHAFYETFKPISNNFQEDALKACNFTREQTLLFPDVTQGMTNLYTWIKDLQKDYKIICWSDNPAFDWQFLNYYLHTFSKENPLGFSCRRIGDLYSGFKNDITQASRWKSLRKTKHSHNALDDATGNAEALKQILSMMKYRSIA
jgi:hypothetical protein